jgi:isoleucyl-tRNA synthetase
MSDFRNTVHVPVTSFPMRGDLLNRQEEILARWQAQDLYRAILEDRRDAQPFIIHDGPPYASGQVHVGIGLNKILKDVVAKFHSMRDRRVPFVPGWDCHGLPIELEVMKSLGERARQASPLEARRLCEEKALRYVAVLLEMVRRGYVSRDIRPITWCIECGTALAEAEEEARSVEGNSIWVWYQCGDALAQIAGTAAGGARNDILVWTTSAWSMPGSVGVAVNPALDYGIYDCTDVDGARRIVGVLDLAASVAFEAIGITQRERIGVVRGERLAGIEAGPPPLTASPASTMSRRDHSRTSIPATRRCGGTSCSGGRVGYAWSPRRGREADRFQEEAGHREIRHRRVQPALQGVGVQSHRRLEQAHRTDRVLDRSRASLHHLHQRLHGDVLVDTERTSGIRDSCTTPISPLRAVGSAIRPSVLK